jgi:superfamily I DNA/RNA helicase
MANVPSEFQAAIYRKVRKPGKNLLVKAAAGAGKTTTTMGALDYVEEGSTVCMLAFNTAIAAETANRVADFNRERADEGLPPVSVVAKTINSMGHQCVTRAFPGVTLNAKKLWTLQRDIVPYAQRSMGSSVVALTRAARTHGMVPATIDTELARAGLPPAKGLIPDTVAEWVKLAKRYEIEISHPRPVEIDYARKLLAKSLLVSKAEIDYDDQIYLPLVFNLPLTKYDWAFVDEAQDLNDANLELIGRLAKRFLFVGDESQSLYAFRGADADAMDNIRTKLDCEVLPLSITYRCPQLVVKEAQKYDPSIQAAPNAPMGEVANKGSARSAEFKAGDMVVCRFNAPLVQLAFSLIGRNIPIQIQGRDLVSDIDKMVSDIGATSIDGLLQRLGPWSSNKVTRYLAADEEAKAINLLDKVQMLVAVVTESGRVETIEDIGFVLEDLFRTNDPESTVNLSTIHRAKGLENDTIWWLNPNITPKCKTPSQYKQEMNARYVATTRAKRCLYYTHLEGGQKGGKMKDRALAALGTVMALSAKVIGDVDNDAEVDPAQAKE